MTCTNQPSESWEEGKSQDTINALKDRRERLGANADKRLAAGIDTIEKGSMGIAFSGGGIRSATISLGIAQALAQSRRLLDFDYMSTVSGGGYFGSFLGSLFLPDDARSPMADKDASDPTKAKFAIEVLQSKANADHYPAEQAETPMAAVIRHPVRWLREHSRYLAPNGPSDYIAAAAYMIRNWLAMIYVFVLPIAIFWLCSISVTAWALANYSKELWDWIPADWIERHGGWMKPNVDWTKAYVQWFMSHPSCSAVVKTASCPLVPPAFQPLVSFWWLAAFISAFLGLGIGFGYWFTEVLSGGRKKINDPILIMSYFLLLLTVPTAIVSLFYFIFPYDLPLTSGEKWAFDFLGGIVVIGLSAAWIAHLRVGSIFSSVKRTIKATASPILHRITSREQETQTAASGQPDYLPSGDAYIAEMRRLLTRWSSWCLTAMLIFSGIAIIDSLGLSTYAWLVTALKNGFGWGHILALAMAPLGAWLIHQLPGWFGDGESKAVKFLGQHLWSVALVVVVLLYGLVAVASHVLMQWLLFDGNQWSTPEASSILDLAGGWHFLIAFASLLVLTIMTGWSTGFINLSSLHALYAARLTRAYVGATNMERLKPDSDGGQVGHKSIKETAPRDQIPINNYQQCRTAAPLHLINVTLNETISKQRSQLLERDRKGVPLVFAPEGIFVEAKDQEASTEGIFFDWKKLETKVEPLSLGQLCAISGAAASTAMGAKTTLGGALALSFANIRLGYWWDVGELFGSGAKPWWHTLTQTYFYLFNEMTARYSRDYARVNISDGGHFDNSGAYELLRRRVRTIVVADNGADPNYVFEDLENLVRKARIDLGLSINVADKAEVEKLFGKKGCALFLNGDDADWRQRAASHSEPGKAAAPTDAAFCLLLTVFEHSCAKGDDVAADKRIGHILWLKPRLYDGMPIDVSGYATSHPSFPQETTGDQFFDEAQWESYRAIGYGMMHQLLAETAYKADSLRRANDRSNWPNII